MGAEKQKQKEKASVGGPSDILKNPALMHLLLVGGCSLPGALISAIFLLAASVPNLLLSDIEFLALVFLPPVCVFPIIGGCASAGALFRFSKETPEKSDAAAVGALAGLAGSLLAAFFMVAAFFLGMLPFGGLVTGALFNIVSALIVVFVCVLLSLAGAVACAVFLEQRKKHQAQTKLQ